MNYEQDHSHTHCFIGQEGHEKHLRCCICLKPNPMTDKPIHKVSDVVREVMTMVEHKHKARCSYFRNFQIQECDCPEKETAAKTFQALFTTLLSSIVEQIEGEKINMKKVAIEALMNEAKEMESHNTALDRAITIIKSSME